MARQEKTYQTELRRSFTYYTKQNNKIGLWWKIPDVGYCQKPYDSWCLLDGQFYAMEQKICKAKGTFNFKSFFREREHELDSLERVEKAGGISYVTINHWQPRTVNKAYCLPYAIAKRAFEKGSVKREEFESHPDVIEIPRIKDDTNQWVWDLSVIFNKK